MRKSLHPQKSDADDDRICIRNCTAGRFSADDLWLARSSAFAESSVNRPGTPPRVGPPAWNEARRTASPYIAPNPPLGNRWAILARSEAVSTRPERIRHGQRQCCALLSNLRKSAIDHGARKGSNVSRFHAIILRSAMARCRPRTTSTHALSWLLQMFQENVSDDIPT